MGDLGSRLEDLSAAKRALFEMLLAEEGAAVAQAMILPHAWTSAEAPLSWSQRRLWLKDQLDPGSAAYNMPFALRLTGRLDLGALAAALDEIVRRHESLRTTFHRDASGEPVQRIGEPEQGSPAAPPPRIDLAALPAALPAARREGEAAALVEAESARPFDLAAGPLLRVLLLRTAAAEHLVMVNMHHIVGDGWSMGVFMREMSALYGARLAGHPSPLAPLAIQYRDFAEWQRHRLHGELLAAGLAYWRGQLGDAPPALGLPADRPRAAVRHPPAGGVEAPLPAAIGEGMRRLAAAERTTLFVVLLAAFGLFLARESGEEDLVVGTAIAGRERVETEALIGFFVNGLALRLRPRPALPFRALVRQAREVMLGAQAHEELPLDLVSETLGRDAGRPLLRIMLSLENAPIGRLQMTGLEAHTLNAESGTAKYDLVLALQPADGGFVTRIEVRSDLYDAATAERFLAHFEALSAAALADPERPVGELPRSPHLAEASAASRWLRITSR